MIPGSNLIRNTAALTRVLAGELAHRLQPAGAEVVDAVTLPVLPVDPGARVIELAAR